MLTHHYFFLTILQRLGTSKWLYWSCNGLSYNCFRLSLEISDRIQYRLSLRIHVGVFGCLTESTLL